MESLDQIITPRKAAKMSGLSRATIMRHIKQLKLIARRNNKNHWVIDPVDFDKWIEHQRNLKFKNESVSNYSTVYNQKYKQEREILEAEIELKYLKIELEKTKEIHKRLEEEISELKLQTREFRYEAKEAWSLIGEITRRSLLSDENNYEISENKRTVKHTTGNSTQANEAKEELTDILILTDDLRINADIKNHHEDFPEELQIKNIFINSVNETHLPKKDFSQISEERIKKLRRKLILLNQTKKGDI
ncbi:MAG: helix-turn-helix domain-containing protein [Flavobacteriaceae bacterium]|nr:helix-turn-helix domain-containing protein [Flavobacteriaceae bacterium]